LSAHQLPCRNGGGAPHALAFDTLVVNLRFAAVELGAAGIGH
jgi:hypothetical protein